ncbi:MAG: iron ABC transporter substrate-binding protein [Spirochaetaceae bacterium]|nr:MAG: iron ABC transporter substrate-binding protein [Spirochaetaceae bacterium]
MTRNTGCRAALLLLLSTVVLAPLYGAGSEERGSAAARELILYAGRGEPLVDPLIREFERQTGIQVRVRYGGTAELAVLLAEEGERSPADLFWGQDAGALGSLAGADMLSELPAALLGNKPNIYASVTGRWVATSGRARVLAYSPQRVSADEYPESVFDLSQMRYRSRVGWAPTNGSFQAFVTAMRVAHGNQTTTQWLTAMRANDTQAYRNNTALVEAIAAGEIDFALTNNYYLLRFRQQDTDYPVAQRFFSDGDIGNLVNVAGIGILRSSRRYDSAVRLIEFLLAAEAQQFFTDVIYEYPVTTGVRQNPQLEDYQRLLQAGPQIDLDSLEDLEGTLMLLRQAGLL